MAKPLPKFSVLVVCIGSSIGKTGMTIEEISVTNQQINAVVSNTALTDPFFVYYLLTYLSNYIKSKASPNPVPIISKGNFEKLKIPLPPTIEEQKQIAQILQTVDRKIENAKKKKEALQDLFKTMLHKLMTAQIRVKDLEIPAGKIEGVFERSLNGGVMCN